MGCVKSQSLLTERILFKLKSGVYGELMNDRRVPGMGMGGMGMPGLILGSVNV
jgi:hypothetical protein